MAAILVVDDDSACRSAIQRTLEHEDYFVEGAADVDSALRALARRAFDLIVCDYRMPGRTGLDLLEAVKRDAPRIPVLLVSGYADAATEATAAAMGAARFLTKPFRRRDLLDSVAEGLTLRLSA
jgi:DNA-binding NtrC family response regulator